MENKSTPSVVILLLNYNNADDTIECIKSLKNSTYPNYSILLVDNASSDNSCSRFRSETPEVPLFISPRNDGYTGGINFGMDLARQKNPKYILVLNNDTLVTPDFLTRLVEALEENPNAAAAGGTILAEHDRDTVWYANGKLIHWRGLAVHLHKGKSASALPVTGVSKTDFITGCLVLYRTEMLPIIGVEDNRYFMYLDDIEFSSRIIRAGFDLLYVPAAVIYHKVAGETESPFKLYYSVRNRKLLIDSMNSGFVRFAAHLYFTSVITAKRCVWFFTNRQFAKTASLALKDYRARLFGVGNGHRLAELFAQPQADRKGAE